MHFEGYIARNEDGDCVIFKERPEQFDFQGRLLWRGGHEDNHLVCRFKSPPIDLVPTLKYTDVPRKIILTVEEKE